MAPLSCAPNVAESPVSGPAGNMHCDGERCVLDDRGRNDSTVCARERHLTNLTLLKAALPHFSIDELPL